MTYSQDQQWYIDQAAKTSSLPFENMTSEMVAANILGKAQAAAAERMGKDATPGPAISIHSFDGVPTIVSQSRIARNRQVAEIVDDSELTAMGVEPERWPACEFPGCKGQGRCKVINGAGRPLSINNRGQLVVGHPVPLMEHDMSGMDQARALAGLLGADVVDMRVGHVPAAQLVAKNYVDVCFEHSLRGAIPFAPQAPLKLYVTGPYAGNFTATRRVHSVNARTNGSARVISARSAGGKDEFYVTGDDGVDGYKGNLVEL